MNIVRCNAGPRDTEQMKQHEGTFDLMLNAVAASHDLDPFVSLLKRDGTLRMQGIEEAWGRMLNNGVKYRFVVDMATLST